MRRTAIEVERKVIEMILLGAPYVQISAETSVAVSTIKKIKKRSLVAFREVDEQAKLSVYEEVSELIRKTNSGINRILDMEERGEIRLSVSELLAISREMWKQTTTSSPLRRPSPTLDNIVKKYL